MPEQLMLRCQLGYHNFEPECSSTPSHAKQTNFVGFPVPHLFTSVFPTFPIFLLCFTMFSYSQRWLPSHAESYRLVAQMISRHLLSATMVSHHAKAVGTLWCLKKVTCRQLLEKNKTLCAWCFRSLFPNPFCGRHRNYLSWQLTSIFEKALKRRLATNFPTSHCLLISLSKNIGEVKLPAETRILIARAKTSGRSIASEAFEAVVVCCCGGLTQVDTLVVGFDGCGLCQAYLLQLIVEARGQRSSATWHFFNGYLVESTSRGIQLCACEILWVFLWFLFRSLEMPFICTPWKKCWQPVQRPHWVFQAVPNLS